MKEPRKFPAVLTGVMLFLVGKRHPKALVIHRLMIFSLSSPLWRRRCSRIPRLRFPRPNCCHYPPRFRVQARAIRAIPLLTRHPPLRSTSTLPGSPHYGERPVLEERQGQLESQMGEECVAIRDRDFLRPGELGRRERFR